MYHAVCNISLCSVKCLVLSKILDLYCIHYLLETSSQNGGRFEAKGLTSSLRFCVDDS